MRAWRRRLQGVGRDEGWHVRNIEKMVAMPPDPAAVSARTLRENVAPSGAVVLGPRRSLRPGVLLPSASSQTGRKAKTSFEERKTKAPCDRRPSRARIHGATWIHHLCQPRISSLLCPEPLRGGASPPSRSICDVAGYYDFPPGTVAAIRLSHVTPGDSNCTCCMYSYAPLSRSFKVFAAVRQSIYCLRIYR